MDIIIVRMVLKIIDIKTRFPVVIIAAFSGAVMSCIYAVYTPSWGNLWQVLMHIVTGFIMTIVICREKYQNYLKVFLCLNISSALIAGIMNYFYYSEIIRKIIHYFSENLISVFLVSVLLSFTIVYYISGYIVKIKKSVEPKIYTVSLIYKGNEVKVSGLLDTGNRLKEPISGKPVHIIEEEVIKSIISHMEPSSHNIRIIPFHSVGKNKGIMTGIIIDKIIVYGNTETVCEKPVIGLYNGKLSGDDTYSMLLNSSLE